MEQTPNHDDTLELIYTLGTHGWSDLTVLARGGDVIRLRLSHVFSDPLADLIRWCSAVIDGLDISVVLHDEPGAYIIETTTNAKRQHLVTMTISEMKENFADPKTAQKIIDIVVKRSQLVTLFVSQFEKTSRLMNEPSFAEDRKNFPRRDFMDLMKKWNSCGYRESQ